MGGPALRQQVGERPGGRVAIRHRVADVLLTCFKALDQFRERVDGLGKLLALAA